MSIKNYLELNKIMEKYSFSVPDICNLLSVSESRVYSWRTSNTWRRNMPDHMLELLLIRLKKRNGND